MRSQNKSVGRVLACELPALSWLDTVVQSLSFVALGCSGGWISEALGAVWCVGIRLASRRWAQDRPFEVSFGRAGPLGRDKIWTEQRIEEWTGVTASELEVCRSKLRLRVLGQFILMAHVLMIACLKIWLKLLVLFILH